MGFSLSQKRKETMVWPAATSQHHSKQHTVRKEIETSDLSTSELWVLGQHALTVCLSIMIPNRYFKVLANAIQNVHIYLMCASKPIKKNRQLIILQALTQKDKRIYLYREFHCFFFFFSCKIKTFSLGSLQLRILWKHSHSSDKLLKYEFTIHFVTRTLHKTCFFIYPNLSQSFR